MDRFQELRDQANRYRRMLVDVDDVKARAVLTGLIQECDQLAEAEKVDSEARSRRSIEQIGPE